MTKNNEPFHQIDNLSKLKIFQKDNWKKPIINEVYGAKENLIDNIKYPDNKFFNGNHNLKTPILFLSENLPTSATDKKIAYMPNNQYNCHEYVSFYINPKYQPSFARNILSFVNMPVGAQFPSNETLKKNGYSIVQTGSSLTDLSLKPGDIICCVDNSQKNGFKEIHSGIVIGCDKNHNLIIRQKLNETDPVVDMNAAYFDKLELGSNKIAVIYRKEK